MALGLLLNEPVAAVVILIMLTGGEALEDYAMSRAESGIHELLEQEPGTARRILADGSMEEVQATDLAVGDSVMLRTGDTTPVDCEVSESANTPREGEDGAPGSFEVDESMLTGEALPQKKVVGDTVHAGSINISSHPLRTIVLKAHADSAMTMFKATLAAALEKKAKLERSSIQMAADFTPFTLALASCAYWYQRVRLPASTPLVLWGRVLAVTMAATPCPAAIGVPIAFLCGMSISSKHGIAMKSGAALENLGKSTVCVLDKTGTVTYGKPRVRSINFVGKPALKQDEALRLCASLEQTSNHPLAVAMITRAREKQLQMRRMDEVAVTEAKAGHGVAGEVDGWAVRIGTSEYVFGEEDALKQDEVLRLASVDVRPVAQLFAYFRIEGFGGVTRGWVACEDEVRPGAKEMVATFQSRGLRCVMLSGDRNAGTLEHIARHLGARPQQHATPLSLGMLGRTHADDGIACARRNCGVPHLPAAREGRQGGGADCSRRDGDDGGRWDQRRTGSRHGVCGTSLLLARLLSPKCSQVCLLDCAGGVDWCVRPCLRLGGRSLASHSRYPHHPHYHTHAPAPGAAT